MEDFHKISIANVSAFVQIMVWFWLTNKSLSEPSMTWYLLHVAWQRLCELTHCGLNEMVPTLPITFWSASSSLKKFELISLKFFPPLVQIMACRLDGAKPLSEPMLEYCWLDPWEQTSVKYQSKFELFHPRKCAGKCHLENGGHFVSASMC